MMIVSYGIILFVKMFNDKYYLICDRGSSFEYSDIFNPRCPNEKVVNYVRMCTKEERDRLRKYINNFDILYNDSLYSFRSYKTIKDRFFRIKSAIIEGLKQDPIDPIFTLHGFPKGRKKANETGLDAALREFEEEVRIPSSMIRVLGHPPLEEEYTGTDGKKYKNVYFRCDSSVMIIPRKKKTLSAIPGREWTVSDEIRDVKWLTKEQAKDLLDPTSFELLD